MPLLTQDGVAHPAYRRRPGRVKDAVTRGTGGLIAKSAIRTLGRTELCPVAFRIFLGGAVGRVCRPVADISGCVGSRRRIHQAQRPAGFIN